MLSAAVLTATYNPVSASSFVGNIVQGEITMRKIVNLLALAVVMASVIFAAVPAAASAPAPERSAAKFEVKFMTQMIHHHAMAIEMAQMCLEKAVHAELGSMCADIIASQSREIEQMQSWLSDWYGMTHEPDMKPGDMKMMEKFAALDGEEFEIAFMEMMIRHHEQAIREAGKCLQRAYHDELNALCQQIIAAQQQEIAQMQTWLCEWYGECNRSPR
jgi:uncharacterized protein (DUF305 family)